MYRNVIDNYIDGHKEEMLEDLKTLVRIDSKRTGALEGKPFGEGPAKALAAAKEIMEGYGFKATNYDNYVVTADFNEKEKQLDILAHLDVVSVTQDWTVTAPFEPVVKDGNIYGRGTADDKGPAIAALYAMRAIRESGIELDKNVRLILGSDEECGSSDLKYYYSKEQEAPMSFTPDADFPLINIEKGRLAKEFTVHFEEEITYPAVLEIHGGDQVNVVPGSAYAVVKGMEERAVQEAIEKEDTVSFTVEAQGDTLKILAKGVAAHASTPECGKNAVCALLKLLANLPLAQGKRTEAVKSLAAMFPFGDCGGEALGVAMEDEISGNLTMNLGVLHYDGIDLTGKFDSRVPVCANDENVTKVMAEKFAENGMAMEAGNMVPVHHVPAESLLVRTLLGSYERYSGIKGEPQAIGGGTYVHGLKNGVAFGCMIPEVDNHMHGDDEFMVIDMLLMSAKIFADAILKLCKTDI